MCRHFRCGKNGHNEQVVVVRLLEMVVERKVQVEVDMFDAVQDWHAKFCTDRHTWEFDIFPPVAYLSSLGKT